MCCCCSYEHIPPALDCSTVSFRFEVRPQAYPVHKGKPPRHKHLIKTGSVSSELLATTQNSKASEKGANALSGRSQILLTRRGQNPQLPNSLLPRRAFLESFPIPTKTTLNSTFFFSTIPVSHSLSRPLSTVKSAPPHQRPPAASKDGY